MILYIENPKDPTQKLLDLITNSKIAGCKINRQKAIQFLYIKFELTETEIKKRIPFTTASETLKNSGIYLTRGEIIYTLKTTKC